MNAPAFWRSRSLRERRILAWGAGLAGALLFVALVWLPLARAHARIEAELPQLRASVAALERQAGEVQRLRGIPVLASSATPAGSMPALPGAKVSIPSPGRVHIVTDDVAFAALLDWLAAVQGAQGLHVESAHLEALPTTGRVRADLTLARS
jgi:general secretion pathway protein M